MNEPRSSWHLVSVLLAAGLVLVLGFWGVWKGRAPGPRAPDRGPGLEETAGSDGVPVRILRAGALEADREPVEGPLAQVPVGPPCEILVVDASSSAPVAGAALSFVLGGEKGALGRTDEGGSLRVPLPSAPEGEGWILAEAEGFAPKQARVTEPEPRTLRIHLQREGLVRGTVVDAGGNPAGAGCLVVAWPVSCPLGGPDDVRMLLSRGSRSSR